jgi:hypothetical protein
MLLGGMKSKFGSIMVTGIIGFIAFVFIFYGVFTPKSTRGLHEGSVAGLVNGDSISLGEYNRELNRRIEFFRNMAGGKISDEQLKAFRIKEAVFQELVNRKLMTQYAENHEMEASDEQVRSQIQQIQAFQKDGKFDANAYRQVLAANNYSPASFEKSVREDLSVQNLQNYFKDRVRVSDEEVKNEFLISNDRRNIKFVLLSIDAGRKALQIPQAEINKYLADATKQNLVKSHYEAKKEREYKGKTFEQVKGEIAHDLIASEKVQDVMKANDKLADQVASVMTADKSSDAKVNALLKSYGVQVKSTGLVARSGRGLPGIGEAKELTDDAFAAKSPIDPKQGGKAKKYSSGGWQLVAIVTESQGPDLSKLDASRDHLRMQLLYKKERELQESWLKKQIEKAKIEPNHSVLGDEEA